MNDVAVLRKQVKNLWIHQKNSWRWCTIFLMHQKKMTEMK